MGVDTGFQKEGGGRGGKVIGEDGKGTSCSARGYGVPLQVPPSAPSWFGAELQKLALLNTII